VKKDREKGKTVCYVTCKYLLLRTPHSYIMKLSVDIQHMKTSLSFSLLNPRIPSLPPLVRLLSFERPGNHL
jgi:hypothetical protein